MSKSDVILFGYSGHAKVVIDCLESHNHNVVSYFDKNESADDSHGLNYLGFERDVDIVSLSQDSDVFPAIGDNSLRAKVVQLIRQNQLKQTRAIHNTSFLSNYATVGLSSMIGPMAVVNAGAKIGEGTIINSNATVEHDCVIGDFVHVAPGSILAGNVSIGHLSFIGAGAVVKQGVNIGENVVIGAGSVVLDDIPDNETWAGVPAKKIR